MSFVLQKDEFLTRHSLIPVGFVIRLTVHWELPSRQRTDLSYYTHIVTQVNLKTESNTFLTHKGTMVKMEKRKNLEEIFSEGVTFHQQGQIRKALEKYQAVLDVMPDSPLVNYNKGLVLYELGSFAEAKNAYEIALFSAPGEVDILFNYALCLKKLNMYEDTIAVYLHILQHNTEDKDSMYNLGCCYKDMGEEEKAIQTFTKVLELDPEHISSLNNIAYLHHKYGSYHSAEKYFLRLLDLQPDHMAASHILASIRGDTPAQAPHEYVSQVFDNYSERYEESLMNDLKYSVPQKMAVELSAKFPECGSDNIALDLGCGTGLAGTAFTEFYRAIDGVDLSSEMIRIASLKNIYRSLAVADIGSYLQTSNKQYTLVIAADVFTYFGDLEPIFTLLHKIAANGCFFCFSTEKTNKAMYLLQKSGRYAHSVQYIEKMCRETGWGNIRNTHSDIRMENGKWIAGTLYFVKKA